LQRRKIANVIDPTTEATLFRQQVLERFYAQIEKPEAAPAADPFTEASTTGWTAEMELWAFASST
jgi:hypothetical protein